METDSRKTLHFFTDGYPFGSSEQFIVDELEIIAPEFKEVYVYPIRSSFDSTIRKMPDNAKLVMVDKAQIGITDKWFLRLLFFKEFFGNIKSYSSFKKVKRLYSLLKENFKIAVFLESKKELSPGDVYYSYWMFDWSVVLAILKSRKRIDKFYCRVHGGDLYDERRPIGKQPYRQFVMKNIKTVFSISKIGFEYLNKSYPKYSDRIILSPLGTRGAGINPDYDGKFRLVSCAAIISLKRVHLIAEFLQKIDNVSLEWIHFGDGPLMPHLKEQIGKLPSNIQVTLKGNTPNSEILHFFSNNHITCFISLSETEGVPFSFMEAIGFGIPILSTNVGGVSDLVDEDTGFLVSPEVDFGEIKMCFDNLRSEVWLSYQTRQVIRSKWETKFNAEINYRRLLTFLK